MGRKFAIALAVMVPGTVMAHPGHLADVAGHDHWIAGAAIGTAIVLGLWAGLRGRKGQQADTDEAVVDDRADSEADAA